MAPVSLPVVDQRSRPLTDLRISVTDRCNFRCSYCMPREVYGPGHAFLPKSEILSFEEIARVSRIATELGVGKLRLTGGEPLLRAELDKLVAMLAELPDVELALTTNGSLLAKHADRLARAGLSRVTISLDSLDDAAFRAMNDVDFAVGDVLEGIAAAERAGLQPIKINAVVRRGVNDHTIVDMARHFRGSGHVLRFIEFMDVGNTNGWNLDEVVPAAEIVRRIDAAFPIEPIDRVSANDVAKRYAYRDGAGEVGVITSVTEPFCGDCSRARLSAEGRLYTCLFSAGGADLRGPLRRGESDEQLGARIRNIWTERRDRYSELRTAETASAPKVEMSYIGG